MLDLSKISQTLGQILSDGQQSPLQDFSRIAETLAAAGLDPNVLDGLSPQEIANVLMEHGIDPSTIDPNAIASMLSGSAGGIAQAAADWLGSRLR